MTEPTNADVLRAVQALREDTHDFRTALNDRLSGLSDRLTGIERLLSSLGRAVATLVRDSHTHDE